MALSRDQKIRIRRTILGSWELRMPAWAAGGSGAMGWTGVFWDHEMAMELMRDSIKEANKKYA